MLSILNYRVNYGGFAILGATHVHTTVTISQCSRRKRGNWKYIDQHIYDRCRCYCDRLLYELILCIAIVPSSIAALDLYLHYAAPYLQSFPHRLQMSRCIYQCINYYI